jgi:hypothetical protein
MRVWLLPERASRLTVTVRVADSVYSPMSPESSPVYLSTYRHSVLVSWASSRRFGRLIDIALLIFYADEPEEVSEAFWSQTLTLLSIIVSAAISISENNLTKLHAVIAAQLVMSPLTLFLGVYSIVSPLRRATPVA